jgi:carbamoyltransferase
MTPCGGVLILIDIARLTMTTILGISAFYHDSAAALVIDGHLVAAAQEERFTRCKHDERFPRHAIDFCLRRAGVAPEQIDYVGYYEKPLLKFERLLETYLAFAPRGFRSFTRAMPVWLQTKLHVPRVIRRGMGETFGKQVVFVDHHESHAASAFFPSPFDEAAILTMDGVGEWATATIGEGEGNRIRLMDELRFPHSPGLLYSAFTYFCGFRVNSGEYKLMGLAPYGEPRFEGVILERIIDLKDDGSFRMDLSYFNYCQGLTMTSSRMDRMFGGPPRMPEAPITEREMDIAASVQVVMEEIMLRMARYAHHRTGRRRLCLAGGVALNCVGNGRILREGPFEEIWIQPAAGDAGGALGVALFIWRQLLDRPRPAAKAASPPADDLQQGSLLGPEYSNDEIRAMLDEQGAVYRTFASEEEQLEHVAELLADEQVVGLFQGRMEFGPRALGSRSILGDARSPRMQSVMNLKIKRRESFRPFAPSVLAERASEYFELPPGPSSPYMLLVAPVRQALRVSANGEAAAIGLDKLKTVRSTIPAVTHVDYSARLQTVDASRHGKFRRLLERFERHTGCPVLINTSFNVRGEPIVCTPAEAYRCFMATEMDALVLEDFVLLKREQPSAAASRREAYFAEYVLD